MAAQNLPYLCKPEAENPYLCDIDAGLPTVEAIECLDRLMMDMHEFIVDPFSRALYREAARDGEHRPLSFEYIGKLVMHLRNARQMLAYMDEDLAKVTVLTLDDLTQAANGNTYIESTYNEYGRRVTGLRTAPLPVYTDAS